MSRARPDVPEWADHLGRACWMLASGLLLAVGVLLSLNSGAPDWAPRPMVVEGER